jgi:hypothetical protein
MGPRAVAVEDEFDPGGARLLDGRSPPVPVTMLTDDESGVLEPPPGVDEWRE